MASAAASTVAHQVPPMSFTQMPRVRPPRMLKGTPSPNTNPQPLGEHPESLFWVQGKWRPRGSNAAKDQRGTQTRQAAKALRHETHGLNIYAYRHIRTNQVVYSLTRTLENNKILKQLVFHGKKTVPASIRRDMWTPYFSIHFPPTPAGALEGLFAFQKLRELSLQRQLSPPDSLIRVTQEDIDVVKSKLGSPTDLQELAVRDRLAGRIPKLNEILPKKLHARRLMDQKATSVADAAFVLDWISAGPSPLDRMIEIEMNRVARHKDRSKKARRRINAIRGEEAIKKDEIIRRAALALQDMDAEDRSRLPLSDAALTQLSMEHHGVIDGRKIVDIDQVKELKDAVKEWESFVHIDPSNFNTDEWNRRQYVLRAAEREGIEEWFEEHQAPTTESDSVWNRVAEKRESALKAFDEEVKATEKERQAVSRETALKRAEEAATRHYEQRKGTGSDIPSLEQTIEQYKKTALEVFEEQEEQAQKTRPGWADTREIKVFWADLNDGLFAPAWPQNVIHGQLAPYGVAKAVVGETDDRIIEELVDDEEQGAPEDLSEGQRRRLEIVKSKSVHVIGSGLEDGWMPAEVATIHQEPAPWSPRPAEQDAGSESEQAVDTPQESAELEQQDFGVYYEEPKKGIWARVRGIFGR